jgi:hypothetical protein
MNNKPLAAHFPANEDVGVPGIAKSPTPLLEQQQIFVRMRRASDFSFHLTTPSRVACRHWAGF